MESFGRLATKTNIAARSDLTATNISVDASGFDGNLTTSDDTVQEVAQAIDDIVIPTSRTDEDIRDVMGATLVAGTNVTITVDDVANTITINSTAGTVPTPTPSDDAFVYGFPQ